MGSFNDFWEEAIIPSIDKCLKEIKDEEKKQISLHTCNEKKYKKKLKKLFCKKREWLKKEYLPNQGTQAVLDFHKLSAILCRSMIGEKFFLFSEKQAEEFIKYVDLNDTLDKSQKLATEINTVYINYKLAFYASVGIAYIDLFSWVVNKLKEAPNEQKYIYIKFKDILQKKKFLTQYNKSTVHDDFVSSTIISLMKNDILMRDFDYLSYATIMFQWQEYTKQSILINILSTTEHKDHCNLSKLIELM